MLLGNLGCLQSEYGPDKKYQIWLQGMIALAMKNLSYIVTYTTHLILQTYSHVGTYPV